MAWTRLERSVDGEQEDMSSSLPSVLYISPRISPLLAGDTQTWASTKHPISLHSTGPTEPVLPCLCAHLQCAVFQWMQNCMDCITMSPSTWEITWTAWQYFHLKGRIVLTVSLLGRDKGYTVKYFPLPEGVPEGKAWGNSWRQRVIFDRISRVES